MKSWQPGASILMLLLLAACSPVVEAPPDQVVIIQPPSAVADQAITSPEPAALPEPAPAVASLNLPSATVISVGDGDTIRMDYQGENITVRFACIDAPETSQTPWGPAATDRLRELIPRGSTLQFREADTDRFGRMVAEGHAVVYTQFLRSCPETRDALLAAEAQAQQQRLNFWSQDNPVMPWDYRQSNRS